MSFCRIAEDVEHEDFFRGVNEMLAKEFPEAPLMIQYVGAAREKEPPRLAWLACGAPVDVQREARKGMIHVALGMADLFNDMYDKAKAQAPELITTPKMGREQLAISLLLDAVGNLTKSFPEEVEK